jgi:hypothetical protein
MGDSNTVAVTGHYTLDASQDIILDAGGNTLFLANGSNKRITYNLGTNQEIDVVGNLTYDVAGDINLDAGGNTINLKGNGTTRISHELGASNTTTVTGDLTDTISGDYVRTVGNQTITDSDYTHTSNTATHNTTGDFTVDAESDIVLDANGGDVFLKDGGTTYGSLTNTPTSGNLIVKSGTTTALTFSGANVTTGGTVTTGGNVTMGGTTISRTGVLTLDVSSNINLDAGTGILYLKDNGITYGSFRNPAGARTLDIYSNTSKAISVDSSSNVAITGNVTQGTTLGTTSNHLGGAINEIHTELDSDVADLQTTKGRVAQLESDVDSNETLLGATLLYNVDNPYSWVKSTPVKTAINDLDSAVGTLSDLDATTFTSASDKANVVAALNVLAGDVQDLQDSAGTLDGRIGSLANLAAFFDSAGATSSIVNALNHMASRVVDIYDENGTLLNT